MRPDDDAAASAEGVAGDAPSRYGSVAGLDSLPLSGDATVPRGAEDAAHPFEADERTRYRDPQVVARGGMGRVSAVTDLRLRRQVALKEAVPGGPGAHGLERRLAQEAWITAQLEHPGIVPVYDAGRGEGGRPFFTMRLIRGRSLATALADGDLDESTLLRHFLAVCQAMGYAHAMGVVHRDLKPANLMLGEFGETQIVDWGLARAVDGDDDRDDDASGFVPVVHAARTTVGARVGTPAYMSPEQAHAVPLGRSSDVWSLGAILFELVTGRALYDGLGTAEIFVRLDRGPVPRVADVAPDAPPELAAIVAHALHLDPADRYPDAKHLADDVAAYLDGRRVAAFAYSTWDLVKRFGRAFRVPLLAAAAAFIAIGVVFALSYGQTRAERDRARDAEAAANVARDRALVAEQRTASALAGADQSFAALLVRGAREASLHDAQAEAELLAAHALLRGPSPEARGVLARWSAGARARLAAAEPAPDCLRARLTPSGRALLCVEAEAASLWDLGPLALRWRVPTRLERVAFASDAVAMVNGPGHERGALLDLEAGVVLAPLALTVVERVTAAAGVAVVDDGDQLFQWRAATGERTPIAASVRSPRALSGDGRVALVYDDSVARASRVDLGSGAVAELAPLPFAAGHGPMSAALDHDGAHAALGSTKGELVVADVPGLAVRWRRQVTDRALSRVLWSPDDRWIAVRDERGWVSVYDAVGGSRLALPRLRADDLAWRGAGAATELVVAGDEVRRYLLPSAPRATRYAATAGVAAVALSADGALVALPDGDGAVRVYDVGSGALVGALPGDGRAVAKDAAFLAGPEPRLAVIWPGRYALGVWRPRGDGPPTWLDPPLNYQRVLGAADGSVLAVNYGATTAHFPVVGEQRRRSLSDGGTTVDACASTDGRVIAWLSSRGAVEVAAFEGDRVGDARTLLQAPGATRVALDGDGGRLALARDGELSVVDVATGATLRTVRGRGGRFLEVALSADGAWLAGGAVDGAVWVWGSGDAPRMVGAGHLERVSGLAFDPGGDWLVSVGWDGVGLRWDLRGLDADPAALTAALQANWGVDLDHATHADLR